MRLYNTILVLQLEKTNEYWLFEQKCNLLLQEDVIRFAGLISSQGRHVAGGFKPGIIPLVDAADMQQIAMELALRVAMRKEFDYALGSVKYTVSQREKVVMMSFPISSNALLVSAMADIDIDKTVRKIMKIMGLR